MFVLFVSIFTALHSENVARRGAWLAQGGVKICDLLLWLKSHAGLETTQNKKFFKKKKEEKEVGGEEGRGGGRGGEEEEEKRRKKGKKNCSLERLTEPLLMYMYCLTLKKSFTL